MDARRSWLFGCVLLTGCAGIAPQQVGQVVGTIAGAAVAPGIGAPIGNLAGLLAGMMVQGQVDHINEKHERVDLKRQLGSPRPAGAAETGSAPQGQPTRVWVDEAVQNGRLVVGHFEQRYLP